MNAEKYFEKNGCIYGISTKFDFGLWTGYAKKFNSLEEARKMFSFSVKNMGRTVFCGVSENGNPYHVTVTE